MLFLLAGCRNEKLTPRIEGAPNYRQVVGLPVFGVAIPTVSGLTEVMHLLSPGKQRKVIWHNMREEPVLYVNGAPFVLRDYESPFSNLEYTGIESSRVEEMERRLKDDVFAEAAQYGGHFLVTTEIQTHDGKMLLQEEWQEVNHPRAVQTPRDLYEDLMKEGWPVDYLRVPMTDEKAPKDRDCDMLVKRLLRADPTAALMFNCQMGRGRTTTGMVIASIMCLQLQPPKDGLPALDPPNREGVSAETTALLEGSFPCVRALLRSLDGAVEGKRIVDDIFDRCNAMQNLREAILSYLPYLEKAKENEKKKAAAYKRGVEYLERYFVLIAFATWAKSDHFQKSSFQSFWHKHPELESILHRLVWKKPPAALVFPDKFTPGIMGAIPSFPDDTVDLNPKLVMEARSGVVLSPLTVLKADPFPTCHTAGLRGQIEGAPNFHRVEGGLPVFGVGVPTKSGMRNVLNAVAKQYPGKRLLWVNLREETVAYIHDTPYVLRDATRPFKNMQEYTGIAADRLERMEVQLKQDIIQEAGKNKGRVMVCTETQAKETVAAQWERAQEESVCTSAEAFREIEQADRVVNYLRLPVTHMRSFKDTDFDKLVTTLSAADDIPAVIFSCQSGRLRTTTGMVVANLVLRANMPPAHRGQQFRDVKHTMSARTLHADPGPSLPQATEISPSLNTWTGGGAGGGPPQIEELSGLPGGLDDPVISSTSRNGDTQSAEWLLRADYGTVRRLVHSLVNGEKAKAEVDAVIEETATVAHLREVICAQRARWSRSTSMPYEERVKNAIKYGIEHLERYIMLIMFTVWLHSVDGHLTFQQWLNDHPEVASAKKFLRENPLVALDYHRTADPYSVLAAAGPSLGGAGVFSRPSTPSPWKPADPPPPWGSGITPDQTRQPCHAALPPEPGSSGPGPSESFVLKSRRGRVLAPDLVLTRYHFPGKRKTDTGVPSYTRPDGLPMCAVATPTVRGLRLLLQELATAPGRVQLKNKASLVLTDLRDEPLVYICGEPYVLREHGRPTQKSTHADIESMSLEKVEEALCHDILSEIKNYRGHMLLHNPEDEVRDADAIQTVDGEPLIQSFWMDLGPNPLALVQTPLGVAQELMKQGLSIAYRRVPLSYTRNISTMDLDALRTHLDSAPPPTGSQSINYVFMTQTGYGAAGYAMAMTACVLASRGVLTVDPQDMRPGKRHLEQGEYREILSLMRVLESGSSCKGRADWAVSRCTTQLEAIKQDDQPAFKELELVGTSHLQRYFLLVAYNAYLSNVSAFNASNDTFAGYIEQRGELKHLISILKLE
eukprot:gene1478-2104_t